MKKSVKITAAWMDGNKMRCRGICEGLELDFVAAIVGRPDKNGNMWTKDSIRTFLSDVRTKIENGEI